MILGETYTDRVTIADTDGVPASAGTVTAVVTLPDATTANATVTEPEQGQYDIDYVTAQVGRHDLMVTATGGVLGSVVRKLPFVFNVDNVSTAVQLVGLAEMKAFLNIPAGSTDDDEELRATILSASARVEDETQLWHRVTVTESRPAGPALVLSKLPVVSVTSVTQGGQATPAARYGLQSGTVVASPTGAALWPAALGEVTVVYEAGTSAVPSVVREAVQVTVKHLWRQQRGASRLPLSGAADEPLAPPASLPVEAMMLLRRYMGIAGVA